MENEARAKIEANRFLLNMAGAFAIGKECEGEVAGGEYFLQSLAVPEVTSHGSFRIGSN